MSTLQQSPMPVTHSEPPPPAQGVREVQRGALHDLVALATESAATEAQIERLFQTSTADATKEAHDSQWAIDARNRGHEESLRQKHDERLTSAKAKFESDKTALEQSLQESRERIERDHEPVDRKVREKLQQAIWLADSVFEVAQNQIHEEVKKSKEAVKAHDEAADLMEQRAMQLLYRYGQQLPPEDEDDRKEESVENPAEQMVARRDDAEAKLNRLRGLVLPRMFVGPWP